MPSRQVYETFTGDGITDDIMADAAQLFSDNYGIWGRNSKLAGSRVRMSARILRHQCIPAGGSSSYLVVARRYRERGIAGLLLKTLVENTDDLYGIMSSHPAACLAAIKAFGTTLDRMSLEYIKQNAEEVMAASPVSYVKEAKLAGELFGMGIEGLISGVDTHFFVDHAEPLRALEQIQSTWEWPLGHLPEGMSFSYLCHAAVERIRSVETL